MQKKKRKKKKSLSLDVFFLTQFLFHLAFLILFYFTFLKGLNLMVVVSCHILLFK